VRRFGVGATDSVTRHEDGLVEILGDVGVLSVLREVADMGHHVMREMGGLDIVLPVMVRSPMQRVEQHLGEGAVPAKPPFRFIGWVLERGLLPS